jgi:UDP-N-acetylmuramyl pentapeptide synthase
MELKEASKILVLDPIHGAEVISEELETLGKEAEIFNPYRESSYTKRLDHDLVVLPVHLNPNFEIVKQALTKGIPFMTHHEAVKEIAAFKNFFDDFAVIEVTGTIGKTSTCELIAQLTASNKRVLLHTSSSTRLMSPENTQMFPRLGGTPANVLKVMELMQQRDLTADMAVFEISLGLTGIGTVGVITSLMEDYTIAGGTKEAAAVKIASTQNFGETSIIVHPGAPLTVTPGGENVFGCKGANLWVADTENKVVYNHLRTATSEVIDGELPFYPHESYASITTDFYRAPLEAAFCAVLSLGIAPDDLTTTVSPVVGRMKPEMIKGRFLIDNSNSGTKLKFLGEITESAKSLSEKIILIAGEDSSHVCEGVPVEALKKVVEERSADFVSIILVGEQFRGKITGDNVSFSPHLDTALEKAVRESEEGFVILSNVKTWR